VGGCDLVLAFFHDRKSKGSGVNGEGRPLARLRITGYRRLAAEYTVTKRDAVGQGRFGSCATSTTTTTARGTPVSR
jgi:hypothetical protein